ncbi:MAG TPA: ATP synthase F1 subunit epsilon [Acidimicrobiales bacterium]|nr:ATP synthase F1 subunit epsilon [Acidimicrobiales bacterium]
MATFPASVVTPERVLIDDEEVQAVILRTDSGDATFLANHTPLVGAVVPGSCRLQREDGSEELVAVHGGFVQVGGNRVVLLAPIAELAGEIDVARAQRALEAAQQLLADAAGARRAGAEEEGGPDPEVIEAEAAAERARVRIEVAGP